MRKILFMLLLALFVADGYAQNNRNRFNVDSIGSEKLLKYAYRIKHGIGTDVNLKGAAWIYTELARRGDIDGMRELGKMYLKGQGVPRNYKAACRLLKRASVCDDDKAMCVLAGMYRTGNGVPLDLRKAAKLYRKAASKGNSNGCYGLGMLIYKGMGVKQDYSIAVKLLEKGAKLNHPGCDLVLASYYANGYIDNADYEKAERYYDKAVADGHGWAVDITKHSQLDSIKRRNEKSSNYRLKAEDLEKYEKAKRYTPYDSLLGKLNGVAYTYDWSHNKVLKEEIISINMTKDGADMNMTWQVGDSVVVQLPFKSVKPNILLVKKENMDELYKYKWIPAVLLVSRLPDGTFCIDVTRVKPANHEKLKPVRIIAKKMVKIGEEENLNDKVVFVKVTPVRFNDVVTLHVSSEIDAYIDVSIFDMSGVKVKDCGHYKLKAGMNVFDVCPNVPAGRYFMTILGDGIKGAKSIVKL